MSCLASLLCAVSLVAAGPAQTQATGSHSAPANEYRALLDAAAPALVTVKFVLKVQNAGGTRDFDREITAVMIDRSGVVLCSGVQIGTSRLMRSMGATTPTDIKILIGDDTVGIDANLIATDAELDLAWLRVEEPSKLPANLKFIDFSKTGKLALGDRVMTVNRLDKFFDRTPVISEGRIVGATTKPRDLLVPGVGIEVEPGMPVFTADGTPAGLAVIQSPDPEDMEGPSRGAFATLILASEQLNKATERALAMAAEEAEEEDDSGSGTTQGSGNADE